MLTRVCACVYHPQAVFAAAAENARREKPADAALRIDTALWKQTPQCERDDEDIMICTYHRRRHYSSHQTAV